MKATYDLCKDHGALVFVEHFWTYTLPLHEICMAAAALVQQWQ